MNPVSSAILRWVVIPAGISLYATGIFQTFQEVSSSPSSPDPYSTFSKAELDAIEITPANQRYYLDSIRTLREKQAAEGRYTANLYAHDLKQFKMYDAKYMTRLDKTMDGRILYGNYSWISGQVINMYQGQRSKDFSRVEFDAAIDQWFPAVKKSRTKPEPEVSWSERGMWFAGWALRFYLRGLPFAFMMLLGWRKRMKKEIEDEALQYKGDPRYSCPLLSVRTGPLSFAFSLLVWPIVLFVDLMNKKDEMTKRAEVVATRIEFLSVFSKQEEQLLELGRKMTRDEFRSHLDEIGLTRKHSFAVSLFVTLFLVMVPFVVKPQAATAHQNGVAIVQVDHDVGHSPGICGYAVDAVLPAPVHLSGVMFENGTMCFMMASGRPLSGFTRDVGGVPKYAIVC